MRRRIHLAAGVLVVAGAAAGCGGSGKASTIPSLSGSPSASASANATASGSTESKLLAFSKCMRQNGLPDWPDPVTDADGNSRLQFPKNLNPASQALNKARQACASYLKGVGQGITQEDKSAMQDDLLQLTRCLRKNGVAIDDPDFSKSGSALKTLGKLDRNDPRVAKGLDACKEYLQKLSSLLPGGK